jgi:hypothetical protein
MDAWVFTAETNKLKLNARKGKEIREKEQESQNIA